MLAIAIRERIVDQRGRQTVVLDQQSGVLQGVGSRHMGATCLKDRPIPFLMYSGMPKPVGGPCEGAPYLPKPASQKELLDPMEAMIRDYKIFKLRHTLWDDTPGTHPSALIDARAERGTAAEYRDTRKRYKEARAIGEASFRSRLCGMLPGKKKHSLLAGLACLVLLFAVALRRHRPLDHGLDRCRIERPRGLNASILPGHQMADGSQLRTDLA